MKVIVVLIGYIFSLFGGSLIVSIICSKFKIPDIDKISGLTVKGAGKYIGYFERFIVLTFMLLNQYTAIGLVLTAKSIARFEALKERGVAEYYLIGTLCSISIAILVGVGLRFVIL
ncbi:MAG: hypothetical protein HY769_10200 [Candidatus Stahlbacteria bacterium]|nr:hypothetical protein [Candidatus Stahlbacteria bacterium]